MFVYVAMHSRGHYKVLNSLLDICAPFVYSLIVIAGLEYFIKIEPIIVRLMLQMVIFYIAYIPMLWRINKKTDVISNFFKKKVKVAPEEALFVPEVPIEEQI
jgi:hypothetical protein